MDWGLMQGIGDGLQQLGGSIYKAKYLDKLKEAEEVRKETRAQKRTDAQVAATRMITGPDGVPVMQNYNAKDEPVGAWRLPTPQEIQKVEADKIKQDQDQQLNDLKLDEAVWKQGTRDADRDLDIRVKEAGIEKSLVSGQADMVRAQNSYRTGGRGSVEEATTKRDYIQEVKSVGAEIAKEYGVGAAEFDGLAELAVNRAIIDRIDPISALKQLLKDRGKTDAEPAARPAGFKPTVKIIE